MYAYNYFNKGIMSCRSLLDGMLGLHMSRCDGNGYKPYFQAK